jgi:hypothetical protein
MYAYGLNTEAAQKYRRDKVLTGVLLHVIPAVSSVHITYNGVALNGAARQWI